MSGTLPSSPPLSLSFIIPWFHASASAGGGAEALCRAYAARLAAAGHDVEVLTTCSRDHDADWYTDFHPPGRTRASEGYAVERFPVRSGNRDLFLDLNRRILHGQALGFREERAFLENSIRSDALVAAVAARAGRRILIAMPYLFGLTWQVLMENPGQVVLWPCLHDEGYARLKLIAAAILRARALLYNSAAEEELAGRLYAPDLPAAVIGMGIDPPQPPGAVAPPSDGGLGGSRGPDEVPYFLYVGRQSSEKGVDQLVRLFRRFAAGRDDLVRLVLAGKGGGESRVLGESVVNRGFVSEEEKDRLIRGAVALLMPSVRESFSIALLEALARGTPALVNGASPVTRSHVRAGQCGLWYSDGDEFTECAAFLLENPDLRAALGENGRTYVRRNFGWEKRMEALTEFLRTVA